MAAFTFWRCHCIMTVMENILLTDQQTAAFLALEAREHAEALEQVLAFGRIAQMFWAAGCSTAEILVSLSEVN